jgi:hypothetical protein
VKFTGVFRKVLRARHEGKRREGERGQVSIFIGSMLLTFFLLLAFVLNTGMLVNAKINLQNAADLAAYAGAAVQARQLNDIGYLNYEMRRIYKKFLFRYYVIGNSTLPSFPRGGNGAPTTGPAHFLTNQFQAGPVDLGVPSTCVTFLPNDNFCGLASLPSIPNPSGATSNLDAIMGALKAQLDNLESIRKEGCVGIGRMNQMLLFYWLWNTDPSLESIAAAIQNDGATAQDVARLQVLRALGQGLGLMPREIFLRKRIDTLSQYVNFTPQTGVTVKEVNALKGGSDWAMHERTIQAYLSAYNTLGNNTFSESDNIRMDEILPEGKDAANLIGLTNITTKFDVFATDFAVGGGNACAPYTDNKATTGARTDGCTQCLVPYPQSQRFSGFDPVVGVAKDPSILTYYALRLTAKAHILFSPYGDLEMTAYAAAQPFGSRIGPPVAEAIFNSPGAPAGGGVVQTRCNGPATCEGTIPNLPVKDGESSSPTLANGWAQNDVLFNMYTGGLNVAASGNGPVQQTVNADDLRRAYQVAMAPNPWEMGRYNIPNDSNADPFLESFDTKGVRAIWAPLFTGSSTAANANPAAAIVDYINTMATNYVNQSNAAKSVFSPSTQAALITQINAYVNGFLKTGSGEDGEGLNVIRIRDPLSTRPELSGTRSPIAPAVPDSIIMRDAKRLKTAWNDVLSRTPPNDYQQKLRTGYSVKFVPLNLLRTATGITANGTDAFTNRLPAANGVGNDVGEMKH